MNSLALIPLPDTNNDLLETLQVHFYFVERTNKLDIFLSESQRNQARSTVLKSKGEKRLGQLIKRICDIDDRVPVAAKINWESFQMQEILMDASAGASTSSNHLRNLNSSSPMPVAGSSATSNSIASVGAMAQTRITPVEMNGGGGARTDAGNHAVGGSRGRSMGVPMDLSASNSPTGTPGSEDRLVINGRDDGRIECLQMEVDGLNKTVRDFSYHDRTKTMQSQRYSPVETIALFKAILHTAGKLMDSIDYNYERVAYEMKYIRFWDASMVEMEPSLHAKYEEYVRRMDYVACRDCVSLKRKWNKLIHLMDERGADFFNRNMDCEITDEGQLVLIELARMCIRIKVEHNH